MFDPKKALSKKASSLKPSGIRKFFDLLSGREGVISLTVGQPDFATPWHIRDAGIDSIADGHTFYTSNRGTVELRQEIASYMDRRFDLSYSPDTDILVTVGASEAIDIAIRALCDEGDEVIIPTPAFPLYESIATAAGAVPVFLDLKKSNFQIDKAALEEAPQRGYYRKNKADSPPLSLQSHRRYPRKRGASFSLRGYQKD